MPSDMTDTPVPAEMAELRDDLAARPEARGMTNIDVPTMDPSQEAKLPAHAEKSEEDSILPEGAQGFLNNMGRSARKARGTALNTFPHFIVNNGANVAGLLHLSGEFSMIKAYSPIKTAEDIARLQGENRTIAEVKHFFSGAIKSLPFDMSLADAVSPSFYKDSLKGLKDLEYATQRDMARVGRISNKWGMRSALFGITGMTVASIMPEQSESPDEVRAMTEMRNHHKMQYMGLRMSQALNPLEWANHKREFAGFTMIGAGAFSVMNGLMAAKGGVQYRRNWGHAFGGAISVVAGTQLMGAVDNEQGWQDFGKVMMLRMFTLPFSLTKKFIDKQDGRYWYTGGVGLFQSSNVAAYLVGGAEKLPDGTVIDKKAIRSAAQAEIDGRNSADQTDAFSLEAKAQGEMASELLDGLNETPKTHVSATQNHEKQADLSKENAKLAALS